PVSIIPSLSQSSVSLETVDAHLRCPHSSRGPLATSPCWIVNRRNSPTARGRDRHQAATPEDPEGPATNLRERHQPPALLDNDNRVASSRETNPIVVLAGVIGAGARRSDQGGSNRPRRNAVASTGASGRRGIKVAWAAW